MALQGRLEPGPRVQIFMDRPRNEKCRLGGEIVRRVPGLDEAQTKEVRCQFAESARRAIVPDGSRSSSSREREVPRSSP